MLKCSEDGVPYLVQEIKWDPFCHWYEVHLFNGWQTTFQEHEIPEFALGNAVYLWRWLTGYMLANWDEYKQPHWKDLENE